MMFLLLACVMVHDSHCEVEVREIADDEAFGDTTAAALLAPMSEPARFAAAGVAGTVSVVRGEGPAVAVDGTLVETSRPGGFGIGSTQRMDFVVCEDRLEVPVGLGLVTDDGVVDLLVEALATDGEFTTAEAHLHPSDANAFPAPTQSDPSAFLSVQWTATGLVWVSLAWSGGHYEQIFEGGPE